ncbi:MAG: transcriptional repressor LexA [Clostridiaceae bacterium]|nr:transcriptional repressor LexA [Clostridiaceae bacterium]
MDRKPDDNITDNQRKILEFINKEVKEKGYPPSVREICRAVGFKSTSTVHAYLQRLKKAGYIQKDPLKTRAIKIIGNSNEIAGFKDNEAFSYDKKIVGIPVVGKVTAGQPILAVENIEDYFPLPEDMVQDNELFALKVKGNSMINAGILDGDLVIVRQQNWAENRDIVVALINDEATVKTYYREKGFIRLQPENPSMEPIIIKANTSSVAILGKVIGVFRRF